MSKFICAFLFAAANFAFAGQTTPPPSQSNMVDVVVNPTSPAIITADFQLNSTTTIKAPWFANTITLNNNSNKPVTIIAVQYLVTAKRADGTSITKDITISPSMYNFTASCADGRTEEVNFTDFGMFAPGQSGRLSLAPRNVVTVCGSPFTPIAPLLYVGGNPSRNIDGVTDYTYSVEMKPIGWFGTVNEPDSRFDKSVIFTTN